MTEITEERLDQALRLRDKDPGAWDRLHPTIRDQATILDDVRQSKRHNAERDRERAARGIQ